MESPEIGAPGGAAGKAVPSAPEHRGTRVSFGALVLFPAHNQVMPQRRPGRPQHLDLLTWTVERYFLVMRQIPVRNHVVSTGLGARLHAGRARSASARTQRRRLAEGALQLPKHCGSISGSEPGYRHLHPGCVGELEYDGAIAHPTRLDAADPPCIGAVRAGLEVTIGKLFAHTVDRRSELDSQK